MAIRGAYAAGEAKGFSDQLLKGIENRELQQQKYEDLMIDSAKAKAPKYAAAQTAYNNTVTKAKQLKTDFGFTDTELVGIASKYDINAIYDSMFALQAQAKANNSTLGFDKSAILGTLNLPSSALLPEGMTMEQALRQIAFNTQGNLDASDNPKSEVSRRNAFGKALSQMFSFNPRARAEDLVNGMEIAGFSAAEINAWSPEAGKGDIFPDVAAGPLALPDQDYKPTDMKTVSSNTIRDFGRQFGLINDLGAITPLNQRMGDAFGAIDPDVAAEATAGLLIDKAASAMARIDRNLAFKGYGMGFGNAGMRTDTRSKMRQMIDTPLELQQFIKAESNGTITKLILDNDGDFTEAQFEAVLAGTDPNKAVEAAIVSSTGTQTSDAVTTSQVVDTTEAALRSASGQYFPSETKASPVVAAASTATEKLQTDDLLATIMNNHAADDGINKDLPFNNKSRELMEARFAKWVKPFTTTGKVEEEVVTETGGEGEGSSDATVETVAANVPAVDYGMDMIPADDNWTNSYLMPSQADQLTSTIMAGEKTRKYVDIAATAVVNKGMEWETWIQSGIFFGLSNVTDFSRGLLSDNQGSYADMLARTLDKQGEFYAARSAEIAAIGWSDYVESQTNMEVPAAVQAEVQSVLEDEIFTDEGVQTVDGLVTWTDYASVVTDLIGVGTSSARAIEAGKDAAEGTGAGPVIKALMAPGSGGIRGFKGLGTGLSGLSFDINTTEELNQAIIDRTGELPKRLAPQVFEKVKSFNTTLKAFESSVNEGVDNAISNVVEVVKDPLAAIASIAEVLAGPTLEEKIMTRPDMKNRLVALDELKRQFLDIIGGEPPVVKPKRGKQSETLPMNTAADSGLEGEIFDGALMRETQFLPPQPESVSETIELAPIVETVDSSDRVGTVSRPNTKGPRDPAIEAAVLVEDTEDKFWIRPKGTVIKVYEDVFLEALIQNRKNPLSFKSEKTAQTWFKKNFPDSSGQLRSYEAKNLFETLVKRFPSK